MALLYWYAMRTDSPLIDLCSEVLRAKCATLHIVRGRFLHMKGTSNGEELTLMAVFVPAEGSCRLESLGKDRVGLSRADAAFASVCFVFSTATDLPGVVFLPSLGLLVDLSQQLQQYSQQRSFGRDFCLSRTDGRLGTFETWLG